MGLYEKLKEFQEWTEKEETIALSTEEFEVELQKKFHEELAPAFLYGGYIRVCDEKKENWYRIYITTVAFYFHCEKGSECEKDRKYNVQDTIVYHRDGRVPKNRLSDFQDNKYPYLPLMTLNHHQIGYDITFENEKLKYRASALIREYAIYEETKRKFKFLNRGSIFDVRVTELEKHLERLNVQCLKDRGMYFEKGIEWNKELKNRDKNDGNTTWDYKGEIVLVDKWEWKNVEYNVNSIKKGQDLKGRKRIGATREWGFRRDSIPNVPV